MSTHRQVLVVVVVEVPEGGVGDGRQEDDPEQHPGVKVSERLGAPPPTDCDSLSLSTNRVKPSTICVDLETVYVKCTFIIDNSSQFKSWRGFL